MASHESACVTTYSKSASSSRADAASSNGSQTGSASWPLVHGAASAVAFWSDSATASSSTSDELDSLPLEWIIVTSIGLTPTRGTGRALVTGPGTDSTLGRLGRAAGTPGRALVMGTERTAGIGCPLLVGIVRTPVAGTGRALGLVAGGGCSVARAGRTAGTGRTGAAQSDSSSDSRGVASTSFSRASERLEDEEEDEELSSAESAASVVLSTCYIPSAITNE